VLRRAVSACLKCPAFQTALAVAKRQGARSFGLRTPLSLAKLYQSADRPAEAYDTLSPAPIGFSPTPGMPEIAEPQALMKHLAVKAIRARNGTAALTRTPVLPEETPVGALSAQ
jgi:hypothetical protein